MAHEPRATVWNTVQAVLRGAREGPPLRRYEPAERTGLSEQQLTFFPLDKDAGRFHIPVLYRIPAPLDAAVLEASIREIARRHEILRTIYRVKKKVPSAVLLPETAIGLEVVDCTPEEARRRIDAERGRNFDLRAGPLVVFQLLRLGPAEHLLLANFHHSVFDGWSLSVFARELSALYEASMAGRPSPLPEPALQYADYARWQAEWLQSPAAERQRSYFIEEARAIPMSEAEPWTGAGPVHRHTRVLPPELAARVRDLAAESDATPFMVALAAFDILLYRASGRADLTVASATAGRPRRELLDIIGCFINAIVIRTVMRDDFTFDALLARLRRTCSDAFANGEIPFDDLWRRLRRVFWPAHVMLMYQNVPAARLRLAGVECRQVPVGMAVWDYALMLYLTDGPDGILCEWYGHHDAFAAEDLVTLAEAYETLLRAIADDRQLAVRDAPSIADRDLCRTLARLLRVRKRGARRGN